jgi:acetyl esterase/lipase
MKNFKKAALRFLSHHYINLKKHYKIYRKMLNIVNPNIKPIYDVLDRKIMVGDREIPVRVFHPKKHAVPKILIFYHGGGWVTGNIDSYIKVCANMAKQTKHTVISVDYRLAPENPFPAGVEDCYYVTREIFMNADIVHCKQADITLIGDSAGGNLAAVVSQMARDRGEFLPDKQILLYPSTYNDHSENSPFLSIRENGTDYILTSKRIQDYMDMYVQNEKDRCSPYVAPILAQDLSNQPKTLIITAQYDPLRDEGDAYGVKLKEFGNYVKTYRMEDALHGFLTLPWNSETVMKCYNIINSFLSEA